jgi:hypothetical protein
MCGSIIPLKSKLYYDENKMQNIKIISRTVFSLFADNFPNVYSQGPGYSTPGTSSAPV